MFVNSWVWVLSLSLVVPVFLLARRCSWQSIAVLVCVTAPQWVVAGVVSHRYYDVGFETDLDFAVVAQATALAMTIIFSLAALVGWISRSLGHLRKRA
jgi:hypothetical protein